MRLGRVPVVEDPGVYGVLPDVQLGERLADHGVEAEDEVGLVVHRRPALLHVAELGLRVLP